MSNHPWLNAPQTALEAAALLRTDDAPAAGRQERRGSARRPHRVFQWIAPCIDGRLPERSMFYQVQCIDISRTGIAFYTYEPLPSGEVIIAIGTTADAVYVRSRVANCVPVVDADGLRYRIGCEFLERLGSQPPSESESGSN